MLPAWAVPPCVVCVCVCVRECVQMLYGAASAGKGVLFQLQGRSQATPHKSLGLVAMLFDGLLFL